MTRYLAHRLALSAATLLLITAAVYAAIRTVPGTPTWGEEAGSGGRSRMREEWLRKYHALDPIPVGYARWLGDVARLDLGVSIAVQPGGSVAALIADALPYTALLGTMAFLLTFLLALPLGVLSAWRPRSAGARGGAWLLYALHALPAFWIALALQHLLAVSLKVLPPLGAGPAQELPGALARIAAASPHWVLPTVAVTLGSLAFVIRFCRTSLLEAAAQEYARAARARGAGEARILWRHALANSAVPLVSLTGLMLPGIISGSVLVETIFALPGIGRLFFSAASQRDYPVIMAVSLLTASATLAANLIADLLYRAVDPRLSSEGDAGAPSAEGRGGGAAEEAP